MSDLLPALGAVGQGFNQAVQNANTLQNMDIASEKQVMGRELFKQQQDEYRKSHEPVYVDEVMAKVPPEMKEYFGTGLQASGRIQKDVNGRPYLSRGDMQELSNKFMSNEFGKYMAVQSANKYISNELEKTTPKWTELGRVVGGMIADRNNKIAEARAKNDMPGELAAKDSFNKWASKDPQFQEYQKLTGVRAELEKKKKLYMTALSMKDAVFNKLADTYGEELALRIEMGDPVARMQKAEIDREAALNKAKAVDTVEQIREKAKAKEEGKRAGKGGGGSGSGSVINEERKGRLTEDSAISTLKNQFPGKKFSQAYGVYQQYKKDGYDRATSLNYTMQYMAGNVQGGNRNVTQSSSTSQPAWKKYE